MEPEESAVAKSTGLQEEYDMSMQDTELFQVLTSKKKVPKSVYKWIPCIPATPAPWYTRPTSYC